MISVDKKHIYFQAKDRRKKKQDIYYKLLYGLTCNTCNNILVASFEVDKEVNLWPYEETSVMHYRPGKEYGTFSHYYPTVESNVGDSCYESTTDKLGNTLIQTIRLKSHVLEPDRAMKVGLDKFEPGERTCMYNAVVSLHRDLAMKQALLMTSPNSKDRYKELIHVDWAKYSDEIVTKNMTAGLFWRAAESYGEIPIYGFLIPKEKIQFNAYGLNYNNFRIK